MAQVCKQVHDKNKTVSESEIIDSFKNIGMIWDELYSYEQEKIIRYLIKKVNVSEKGIDLEINVEGIDSLINYSQAQQTKTVWVA